MLNILSDSVKGTSYIFVSMRKLGKLEKLCCSLALVALISLCPNWFQSWKTNSPEYFCSPPPPSSGQLQQTVFHCKITNHPMGGKYGDAHRKF